MSAKSSLLSMFFSSSTKHVNSEESVLNAAITVQQPKHRGLSSWLLYLFFFIHWVHRNQRWKRGGSCYKYPTYKSGFSVSIEIAIFTHSWLFQGWLPLSYVPPTPGVPAGLGSKSVLQTVFVKKIPSCRQVASKTLYMQDWDAHNCVYLSRSLTPHSPPTDVNVFFLA